MADHSEAMGFGPGDQTHVCSGARCDGIDETDFVIHQYDEINRELTWLALAHDLPEWHDSLAPYFVNEKKLIDSGLERSETRDSIIPLSPLRAGPESVPIPSQDWGEWRDPDPKVSGRASSIGAGEHTTAASGRREGRCPLPSQVHGSAAGFV